MMRAILLAGVALLTLTACYDRRPAPEGEPYIIKNDNGGQLLSAEADRASLLAWGGRVEIQGRCASACVIFTTLPNACLAPDARIGFHGSTITVGPVGNPQMARHLRGGVKAAFLDRWQHIPTEDIHWITAREYVALDPQTRLCR